MPLGGAAGSSGRGAPREGGSLWESELRPYFVCVVCSHPLPKQQKGGGGRKGEKGREGKGPNQSPPSPKEMSLAAASGRRATSPRNAKGSLKIYPSVEGSPGILETVDASEHQHPRPPPPAISLSHTDTHWHTHSLTHRRARWRRRRGGGSVCLLVSSCLRFPRPGAHKHAHARSAPLAEGEQPAKPRCSRPGRHLARGEL